MPGLMGAVLSGLSLCFPSGVVTLCPPCMAVPLPDLYPHQRHGLMHIHSAGGRRLVVFTGSSSMMLARQA